MKHKITKFLIIFIIIFMYVSNIFAGWVKNGNAYRYINESTGQIVLNNWIQTQYGYYYVDGYGNMVVGWCNINGKYYYFNTNGIMHTGFLTLNGNTYYLNPVNGQMVTGWIETNNNGVIDYCYFDTVSGQMVNGWKQIDNKWYYFKEAKALRDVWANINGNWYHFDVDGKMTTGWYIQDNQYYYLNPQNGVMCKGWVNDNQGNTYYFDEYQGFLIRNQSVNINGIIYTFDSSGKLINQGNAENNQTYQTYQNNQGSYSSTYNGGTVQVGIGVVPGSANATMGQSAVQNQINSNVQIQAGSTTGPK